MLQYGVRQFLRLAHWHETGIQREGNGRRKEITARFNADDDIDGRGAVMIAQGVDGFAEAGLVFQKRSDVVKIDAGLGKVGHFADQLFSGGWLISEPN